MKKRLPKIKSDKAAKNLLKKDLSDYISPESFKLTSFEFAPKDKKITFRVSTPLYQALQNIAKERGTNYQKLIREALEKYLKEAA